MGKRRIFILGALFCLLLPVFGLIGGSVHSDAPQSVIFLNVGQGDAALLSDGNGFDVLIDGGKKSATGAILEVLRQQGINELDVVVATHPDADHVGGLIGVIQTSDLSIRRVISNGCENDTQTWSELKAAVADRGLSLEAVRFPAVLQWGVMTVYVLHPAVGSACSQSDTNRDSLFLRVDFGSMRYLFTGDVNATVEATIVARQTPLAAQVLKVSHHGSAGATSDDFLAAARPTEGVISVGQNSYGHPAPAVLDRLRQAGVTIWRTDCHGTVRVESDGVGYQVIPQTFCQAVFLPLVIR